LDLEVAIEEFEFLAQGNFLLAAVERGAQQFAEVRDHFVGRVRSRWTSVEMALRVLKRKMGMQLHPERVELGLAEARFEFNGLEFAFPRAAAVGQRVHDAHEDPVNRNVEARAHGQRVQERGGARTRRRERAVRIATPEFRQRLAAWGSSSAGAPAR